MKRDEIVLLLRNIASKEGLTKMEKDAIGEAIVILRNIQ
jgi:heterodisulfide reductase subunit C